MNAREAWIVTLFLVLALILMLAGVVSELVAPAIQAEIGDAWSQAPN